MKKDKNPILFSRNRNKMRTSKTWKHFYKKNLKLNNPKPSHKKLNIKSNKSILLYVIIVELTLFKELASSVQSAKTMTFANSVNQTKDTPIL